MPRTTEPVIAPDDDAGWDTIPTGIGQEWDFDRNGTLTGNYLGSQTVETPKLDSGQATAHQFAPITNPSEVVFIWASAEIDAAFSSDRIRIGDMIRVTFLGREQFTGDDGKPRQIKRYRVQTRSNPNA